MIWRSLYSIGYFVPLPLTLLQSLPTMKHLHLLFSRNILHIPVFVRILCFLLPQFPLSATTPGTSYKRMTLNNMSRAFLNCCQTSVTFLQHMECWCAENTPENYLMLTVSGSSSLMECSGSDLQHKRCFNCFLTKYLSKSYQKYLFQSIVSPSPQLLICQ